MSDETVDHKEIFVGMVWRDVDDFPLTPLEAWFLMRGYAVKPKTPIDRATFFMLPGSLELHDGYLVLRQR